MKLTKSLTISLVLVIGLVAVGCKGGGGSASTPSDVYKQFYAAMEKMDVKGMSALSSDPATVEALFGLMALADEETKKKGKEEFAKKGGIVKTEETITGDTATVKATYKDGTSEDYPLIKKDGKWKVKFEL